MNKEELVKALEGLGIDDLDQLKNASLEKLVALQEKANTPSGDEALVNENAQLKELNAKLSKRLASSEEKSPVKDAIVKVGKEKYKMTSPSATFQGKPVTAEILNNDPKLAEKLVKIKAGFLVKVGG